MRVLVACEFSGIVRDAFLARGIDAVSIDLEPTERPGPHIEGDVIAHLADHADDYALMIAHPPCTFLANSGVRWLYGGSGSVIDPERWERMREASMFFSMLLTAPIPRIAVENPVMHSHAGIRRPDFTVQPWQFGTPETKRTCFWTRNLPPLEPTNIVDGRTPRVHFASPGPNRWKERSRTDPNIAAAIATQYGSLLG